MKNSNFTAQVAEALRPLFDDGTKNYMDDCPEVAPRVAAAIEAGMQAVWCSKQTPQFRAKDHEWYDAALNALRAVGP